METQAIFKQHEDELTQAQTAAAGLPLEGIDVADRDLYATDTVLPYFERLRRESPIHYCPESEDGPFWSITKYDDIKQIELDWQHFSSEPSIVLFQARDENDELIDDTIERVPSFIAMDPPKHTVQRKAVRPAVAPKAVRTMEDTIRERAVKVLDALPVGEDFDWVQNVSIELTTQMLATLFAFPFEERSKLTRWSDVAVASPGDGIIDSWEQRQWELTECLQTFLDLWDERAAAEPGHDLLSMLAHAQDPETASMNARPLELLGNMILLIVGGNDTTRNSMTGGVYALNQYPEEYDKLRADPGLISNMVSEIIRWQTPLAHMRRTAKPGAEFGGQKFNEGDKIVLWYLSANRDEEVFDDGERFRIDRKNAPDHLSFGTGIHYCVGAHLGRMQLQVLWEEIMKRFSKVEVTGEPTRIRSNFVRGYAHLPVRLHPL